MGEQDAVLLDIADVLSQRGPALVLSGAGLSVDSGIPCYRPWPESGAPEEEFEAARQWRFTNTVTNNTYSTASGIPDYRGPDGTRRVTPMQYSEFVGSSEARRRYWARSFVGWRRFHAARPNHAHRMVTRLQELGAVGPVITQNVDGLHQAAGTRRVVELHGNLVEVVCLTCGGRIDRPTLDAAMAADNPGFDIDSGEIRPDGDVSLEEMDVARFRTPLCRECGADTLKPDVVFFGGSVAKPLVQHCFDLTDAAPSLLVLGSSLQVMSGLRFVRRAAGRGIPVCLVTRGPTRGDELVDHRVDGELGAALGDLVDCLQGSAVRGDAAPR